MHQGLLVMSTVDGQPAFRIPVKETQHVPGNTMSSLYPKYYKEVGTLTEVDTYAVCHLFKVGDHSGAIQHATKKLLLSGVRTGGKTMRQDIKEARDTLTRWLELNPE